MFDSVKLFTIFFKKKINNREMNRITYSSVVIQLAISRLKKSEIKLKEVCRLYLGDVEVGGAKYDWLQYYHWVHNKSRGKSETDASHFEPLFNIEAEDYGARIREIFEQEAAKYEEESASLEAMSSSQNIASMLVSLVKQGADMQIARNETRRALDQIMEKVNSLEEKIEQMKQKP